MNEIMYLMHIVLLYVTYSLYFQKTDYKQIAWLCLMPVLANLSLAKQVMILGFEVTTADVYSVAYFVGMNQFHELHGYHKANKMVRFTLVVAILTSLTLSAHIIYTPSIHDTYHEVFSKVYGIMPSIALLSLISFALSQFLERNIFELLLQRSRWSYLQRSLLSASLAQFFDTAFFTYFALSGIMHNCWDVFLVSYFIKQACLLVWFALAVVKNLNKRDYAEKR